MRNSSILSSLKTLGLPTDVTRAVRWAARVKDRFPEAWKDLCRTETRPADAVCRFDVDPTGPGGLHLQTERRCNHRYEDSHRPRRKARRHRRDVPAGNR